MVAHRTISENELIQLQTFLLERLKSTPAAQEGGAKGNGGAGHGGAKGVNQPNRTKSFVGLVWFD